MNPIPGFVDTGYGAAVRFDDIASFHPAILAWCDPSHDGYDVPGPRKGKPRSVIVLRTSGLRLPCVHAVEHLRKQLAPVIAFDERTLDLGDDPTSPAAPPKTPSLKLTDP